MDVILNKNGGMIMFLKIRMNQLSDLDIQILTNRQKSDLKSILVQMEKEDISVSLWTIYEISKLENPKNTFVYCLSDYSGNEVFIYVYETGQIEPHYFKFFNEENYTAVKAESIQEAIEQNRVNWNMYENNQIQKLYN